MIRIRELRGLGYNVLADKVNDYREAEGETVNEDEVLTVYFSWQHSSEGANFWRDVNNRNFDEARAIHPHLFIDEVTARVLAGLGYRNISQLALTNQVSQGNGANRDLHIESTTLEGGFLWSRTPEGSRFWECINHRRFDEARAIHPHLFETAEEVGEAADPTPPRRYGRATIQAHRQYPATMNEAYQSDVDDAIEEIRATSGVPASALGETTKEKPKKVKVGNNVYGDVTRTTVGKSVLKRFIKKFREQGGVVSKSKGVTVFKFEGITVGRFTERKDGRMAGRVTKCVLSALKEEPITVSISSMMKHFHPELSINLSSTKDEGLIVGNGGLGLMERISRRNNPTIGVDYGSSDTPIPVDEEEVDEIDACDEDEEGEEEVYPLL